MFSRLGSLRLPFPEQPCEKTASAPRMVPKPISQKRRRDNFSDIKTNSSRKWNCRRTHCFFSRPEKRANVCRERARNLGALGISELSRIVRLIRMGDFQLDPISQSDHVFSDKTLIAATRYASLKAIDQ